MALNFPNSPTDGETWTDASNNVVYTYSAADDSWTGTLSSANAPINPDPGDVTVTPAFGNPSGTNPGTGTLADPYMITTSVVDTVDGTAQSDQFITITNGSPGNQVLWVNNTTPAGIAPKFTQPVGMINADGKWEGYLHYNDNLGDDTTTNSNYSGKLQVGSTSVHFAWLVQQMVSQPITVDTASVIPNNTNSALLGTELTVTNPVISGGIAPYTYSYQWESSASEDTGYTNLAGETAQTYTSQAADVGKFVRCLVTVLDSGGVAMQATDSASNALNIISLAVTINNTSPAPGDILSADDVVSGGKPPETTTYQWLSDASPIGGATNQSYTVPVDQAGKRLSVKVTLVDAVPSTVEVTSAQTDPVVTPTVGAIAKASTRFNADYESSLGRTMGQGDQRKWTWSGWVKRTNVSTSGADAFQDLFSVSDSGSRFIRFQNNQLHFYDQGNRNKLTSTVYTDVASWYHVVMAIDYAAVDQADKVKGYINGVEVEWGAVSNNYSDEDGSINGPFLHNMGRDAGAGDGFLDAYLSDVYFVDSQALPPTAFGQTDPATGKWVPKDYTIPIPPSVAANYDSDLVSSSGDFWSGNPVEDAFDGRLDTFAATSTQPGTLTFTVPSSLTGQATWRIYVSNGAQILVDGNEVRAGSADSGQDWYALGSINPGNIAINTDINGNTANLWAIEVDGSMLINTSGATFSNDLNVFGADGFDPATPAHQGFNGQVGNGQFDYCQLLSSGASNPNYIEFTPAGGIPYTSSVEVYLINAEVVVNFNDGPAQTLGANTWSQIASGTGTVNKITFIRNSTSGASFSGIRVDGVILTNTYGYNSFHLPMDPAVNGLAYEGNTSTSGGTGFATTNPAELFNGNTTTGIRYNSTGSTSVYTLNLANNIDTSSGFITVQYLGTGSARTIAFNNEAPQTFIQGSGASIRYATLAAPTPVVNKITFQDANGSGASAIVSGLFVEGKEILNYSAIGADSSGLGNNWGQFNLVGKDQGKVWTGVSGDTENAGSSTRAFDGTIAESAVCNNSALEMKFKNLGLTGVTSFRYYVAQTGVAFLYTLEAGGTQYNDGGSSGWRDVSENIPANGNIDELSVIGSTDPVGETDIAAIQVNGDTLINPAYRALLFDTPSDYDNSLYGAGNFSTLNPLAITSTQTLLDGNLICAGNGNNWGCVGSTIGMTINKWYCETTFYGDNASSQTYAYIGVANRDSTIFDGNQDYVGKTPNDWGYSSDGAVLNNSTTVVSSPALTRGDVVGMAFDVDSKVVNWYVNGTLQATVTVNGPAPWFFAVGNYGNGSQSVVNFGQRAFQFTKPDGYNALCTFNLTDPPVTYGETGTQPVIYTGNGATQSIDSLSYSPGLVWIKDRSLNKGHALFDQIRGVQERISSEDQAAESNQPDTLTAFNADGFTVGSDAVGNSLNDEYVAWSWYSGPQTTTVTANSYNSTAYNTAGTWSAGTGPWTNTDQPPQNAYNGVVDYAASPQILVANGPVTLFAGPALAGAGLTVQHTISLYTQFGYNNPTSITFESTTGEQTVFNTTLYTVQDAPEWTDFEWSGPLNKIIYEAGGGTGPRIGGIMIDGVLLVDNGTSVPNTPTYSSQVRANPATGFSIVEWTPDSAPGSVAHGLQSTPKFWISKVVTEGAIDWYVYHEALGPNSYINLNTAAAEPGSAQVGYWGTGPTKFVMPFGSGTAAGNNRNGQTMIAYAWSEIEGYSSFGSYIGNDGAGGPPFVYCGFRPAYVLIKAIDVDNMSWGIYDSARNPYNSMTQILYADKNDAETTATTAIINTLSNGFRIAGGAASINTTGGKFLYAAFAADPFKYANAH